MSRFVLYKEVFFIWSVLYRRFHCNVQYYLTSWFCERYSNRVKSSLRKKRESERREETRVKEYYKKQGNNNSNIEIKGRN